jgi:hypothetical protein
VFELEEIKTPLLTGTQFASYSLGYKLPGLAERLGVVWTEDQNMTTFFCVMKACQKAAEQNPSLSLRLIRAEGLGSSNNQSYKLFMQIFTGSRHHRIIPNLTSVHYLDTYHNLVKDAREGDLVIGSQTIELKNLQTLTRESKVLDDCPLLQDLGIVKNTSDTSHNHSNGKTNGQKSSNHQPLNLVKTPKDLMEAQEFLLNLVTTQKLIGREILLKNARYQFAMLSESQIEQLIEQLAHEKRVQILNPIQQPEAQLICLVTTR